MYILFSNKKIINENKMTKKSYKFSIAGYKSLLSLFKTLGVNFRKFNDKLYDGTNVLLRHDIDFCPLRALRIAQIERKMNIKSTFFFLVNTDFYNLNSYENKNVLKEIVNLGHEIGLHFDASTLKKINIINKVCKAEVKVLENLIEKKIYIISFHRPAEDVLLYEKRVADLEHTYMTKFIKKIDYCSDSQGDWRHNNPVNLLKSNKNKNYNLHLLLHPIWWTTPENLSPAEKIAFHLKNKYKDIKKAASLNCKPYLEYIQNKR